MALTLFSKVVRVVLLSILVLCALRATASAEGTNVRAAVLVSSAGDRALMERVRGQTSDLDVEITVHDARSTPPTYEARLREADAVAQRSQASAVIWFRVAGGAVVVYVSVPLQDRVLVRSLGGGAGKPSSSTLEAAALVVRDVLRALAEGATVGELRVERGGHDEPPPLPLFVCVDPACWERAPPLTLAPSARPARAPIFVSSAGWEMVRARDAPKVMNALELRLGTRYESFSVTAVLTLGAIDVERVTESADLQVRRHSLALGASATRALSPDVSVAIGLKAGAVSFIRSARAVGPTFTPTETRARTRLLAGPEARFSWAVAGTLALVATVGVDAVLAPPRFDVAATGGRTGVYSLASVQPRLGFGLEWSSSKLH